MALPKKFYESIYQIVREIPFGRVTSYGAIGQALGAKGSARVIGYAMNKSHSIKGIPAHRVVNRSGILTGKHHFNSLNQMQYLLEQEGIVVIDDKIQNFKKHFWDPLYELNLEEE
ncbi:MAG: cysteine methyltransferase [Cryomorphaceae bacterium]|jgi:methylated-DNA-protein-cysteine methyltransferase-like protein|nr:cysteine methyltransferase [Cryomorphaceae bacterium]|tara:strand:- start:12576 stop:12920 length:345 start_codon:yes stop_codon:yes gene_type:complete